MTRMNALTIALAGICAGLLGGNFTRHAEAAPVTHLGFDPTQPHDFDEWQRWTQRQLGTATLCSCLEPGTKGRMGWVLAAKSNSNNDMLSKCWLPIYNVHGAKVGGNTCRDFAVIQPSRRSR